MQFGVRVGGLEQALLVFWKGDAHHSCRSVAVRLQLDSNGSACKQGSWNPHVLFNNGAEVDTNAAAAARRLT